MIDVLVPITRRLWWLSVLRFETSHDIFFLEESADDDLVEEDLADLVILLKFRRNKLSNVNYYIEYPTRTFFYCFP